MRRAAGALYSEIRELALGLVVQLQHEVALPVGSLQLRERVELPALLRTARHQLPAPPDRLRRRLLLCRGVDGAGHLGQLQLQEPGELETDEGKARTKACALRKPQGLPAVQQQEEQRPALRALGQHFLAHRQQQVSGEGLLRRDPAVAAASGHWGGGRLDASDLLVGEEDAWPVGEGGAAQEEGVHDSSDGRQSVLSNPGHPSVRQRPPEHLLRELIELPAAGHQRPQRGAARSRRLGCLTSGRCRPMP
mmetsp:Transcript_99957/g.278365  ORF Transcript_99957/g.278365 Transcript_99957/m.278365 type:complete len:250 (+) Transcript_99957:440-1189(+)